MSLKGMKGMRHNEEVFASLGQFYESKQLEQQRKLISTNTNKRKAEKLLRKSENQLKFLRERSASI